MASIEIQTVVYLSLCVETGAHLRTHVDRRSAETYAAGRSVAVAIVPVEIKHETTKSDRVARRFE